MKSYFSLFLLVMAFSLVYTIMWMHKKSKTKNNKKKDSENTFDDYVPDTYVPMIMYLNLTKKTVKGKTNSAAKSKFGPKSTGPTAPVIVAKDTVRKPDADAPLTTL